jgi:hypothetical protein
MAKPKSDLSSIFKSTERKPRAGAPGQHTPETARVATGRTVSVGVGLKESEVAELNQVAAELGIARNELMGYALRRFLAEVREGRLNLAGQMETTTRRRLRKP